MATRVNVGITGDNSGLQTAINQSRNTLKDFVTDFSRKASELNAMSGKVGDAQRKLVLSGNLDSQAKAVGTTLGKLNSQINVANGLYQMNGDRISLVQAKTQAYTAALTDLLSRGLKPDSDSAKALTDQIRRLNAELYVLEGPKRAADLARKLAEEQRKAGEAAAKMAEEKRKADEKAAEAARRLAEEEKKAAEKAAEAQRRAAQQMVEDRRRAKDQIISMTKSVGQTLSLSVTAPLAAMTTMSLKAYGELDALRKGLAVVEGSAEGAMRRQKELKQIYALPGLGIQEALRGDVLLRQAGGYSSGESMNIMKQFGNAIALGGGGKEQFGLVLMQLTQMSTKTKVLAEDLKPLINQAPVAAGAIRKLFGTVDSEQISKKLEAAGKGPREFISMLTDELAKSERVGAGFKNGWENLQDSLTVAGDTFGRTIDKNVLLTEMLAKAADGVEALANWFENLSDSDQRAILAMGAFVAATGPAIYIAGSLASTIVNLSNAKKALTTVLGAQRVAMMASLGPYALLMAAVTLAVGSIIYFAKAQENTIKSSQELADVTKEVAKSSEIELGKIKSLIAAAQDEKRSKDERAQAIYQLKAQYPDYFKNIDAENIKTQDLKKAYDALAISIVNATLARAKQEKLDQLVRDREVAREKVVYQRQNFKDTQINAKTADDAAKSEGFVSSNTGQFAIERAAKGLKDAKVQVDNYDQAIKTTTDDIIKLNIETGKSKPPVVPTADSSGDGKKGKSDITEAINLLEELRSVEKQTSDSRRKLNDIEIDGHEQVRKIFAMKISEGMKYLLLIESIQATERKLDDARREEALKPIFNKPKLTPSNTSVFDYLGNKGNQDVSIRMKLLWSEDKRAIKDSKTTAKADRRVAGYTEMEQYVAAINNIDLTQPLNAKQKEVMGQTMSMIESWNQAFTSGMLNVGMDMAAALGEGWAGKSADFGGVLKQSLGNMLMSLGKSALQIVGPLKILNKALATALYMPGGPLLVGVGALGLIAAGSALVASAKPKGFATGGIAYGRIFGNNAVAGEYSNVRNNPEVIAPLKDLTHILKPYWVSAIQAGMGANYSMPTQRSDQPIIIEVNQNDRGAWSANRREDKRVKGTR